MFVITLTASLIFFHVLFVFIILFVRFLLFLLRNGFKKKLIFNDDVLSFDNDCVSNGFSLALTITWVN